MNRKLMILAMEILRLFNDYVKETEEFTGEGIATRDGFTWVTFGTGEVICYATNITSLRNGVADQFVGMGKVKE